MRRLLVLLGILAISDLATAQKPNAELPSQFVLGVHTFFDFGPPFDFYQLYFVQADERGNQVERIILTPEGIRCFAPPKIEDTKAELHESIAELLGNKNPCSISEKELKKEKKRCKKCGVYSGASVTMQVQCGGVTRLIRSDILDRDMFGAAARTPENTAWTMDLLTKLDKAAGPGVMEKPMFAVDTEPNAVPSANESETMKEVADGKFDGLFPSAPHKASDLYREAHNVKPAHPTVTLFESLSIAPATFMEPQYPPLARLTRTEGKVTFAFEVGGDGTPQNVTIVSGHKLLQQVVLDAVALWRFPVSAAGQKIQDAFDFALNCPK